MNSSGQVYFTHGGSVMTVGPDHKARVLVHDEAGQRFYQLHHLVLDADGHLYTASDSGTGIWKIDLQGRLSRYYPPPNQDRSLLVGLGGDPFTIDTKGNIYAVNIVDQVTSQILQVTPSGRLTVLAGGAWGFLDGNGAAARFRGLHDSSMTIGPEGGIYLTDGGQRVRKVEPDGTVITLGATDTDGNRDQPAPVRFKALRGIAVDREGTVYVADAGTRSGDGGRLYRVSPGGAIQLVAGGGDPNRVAGPALDVGFTGPTGLAFGPGGHLYVLEPGFPRIRRLTPKGRVESVLDGLPGRGPTEDGGK